MSEPGSANSQRDPKEAMREALERKRAQQHSDDGRVAPEHERGSGPHGKVGGKREFRRKAGG